MLLSFLFFCFPFYPPLLLQSASLNAPPPCFQVASKHLVSVNYFKPLLFVVCFNSGQLCFCFVLFVHSYYLYECDVGQGGQERRSRDCDSECHDKVLHMPGAVLVLFFTIVIIILVYCFFICHLLGSLCFSGYVIGVKMHFDCCPHNNVPAGKASWTEHSSFRLFPPSPSPV